MKNQTRVFWITGLSGAGKTTIGKALYTHLKSSNPAAMLLDGDKLREVMGGVFGYTVTERLKSAMCCARLCKLLAEQDLTVVCCTVSMFKEVWAWNRANIPGYTEVYIKVSSHVLMERDQKNLYSGVKNGVVSDVVGLDLLLDEPSAPDIVINNEGDISISECVEMILQGVCKK